MDSSSWLHKVLLSDISRNGDREARPCSQVGERREVLVPGSAPGTPRILPARILWDLLGMSSHREKQHGDLGKQGEPMDITWTSHQPGCLGVTWAQFGILGIPGLGEEWDVLG